MLPVCRGCGTVQYPLRELCRNCLGDMLEWSTVSGAGTLLSWTFVHASLEPYFDDHRPWPVGKVKLDCGPVVIAHLGIPAPRVGASVWVQPVRDAGGVVSLVILSLPPPNQLPQPIDALKSSYKL